MPPPVLPVPDVFVGGGVMCGLLVAARTLPAGEAVGAEVGSTDGATLGGYEGVDGFSPDGMYGGGAGVTGGRGGLVGRFGGRVGGLDGVSPAVNGSQAPSADPYVPSPL